MSAQGKTILLAVDESSYAQQAFEMAVSLLRPSDSLVIVHVVEIQKSSILDPFHEPLDKVWNYEQQQKVKPLQEKFESLCKQHKVENYQYFNITATDARTAICEAADKHTAQLLILGSRGLGTLSKLVLGSVSDYVVHHASCPVLVVKPRPSQQ